VTSGVGPGGNTKTERISEGTASRLERWGQHTKHTGSQETSRKGQETRTQITDEEERQAAMTEQTTHPRDDSCAGTGRKRMGGMLQKEALKGVERGGLVESQVG